MAFVISPITGQKVEVKDNSILLNAWQRAPEPAPSAPSAPSASQVQSQGTGFGGQLNQSDLKTFQSLGSPDAQQAFLSGLAKLSQANDARSNPAPAVYGGYTYGTDPTKDAALVANSQRLKTDPSFKQSETQRALAVYNQSSGDEKIAAYNYLTKDLGYQFPNTSTIAGGSAVGGSSTGFPGFGTTPTGNTDYNSAINNLAQALTGRINQQGQSFTDQLTDFKNSQAQREAEIQAKNSAFVGQQTGLINDLFTNSQNSRLAALRNARDTQLQGLNAQETGANQNAYTQANQADAAAQQAGRRLKEIMADQGLTKSGDNIAGNTNLLAARNAALSDINQTKGNTLQNILEQRSLINNQAASNEQSVIDQLNAEKAQALIDLQRYADQRGIQLDQNDYQRYADLLDRTMTAQNNDFNQNLSLIELLSNREGQQFEQGVAQAGLTGIYNGQPTLDAKNQQFNQNMQTQQFDFQKATQAWNQAFQTQAFNYQKAQDLWNQQFKTMDFEQSVKQAAAQLGYNYAKMTQDQQQFATETAYREKAFETDQDQKQFQQGMDTYSATGQMPSFMSKYGIDTKGLNDPQIKQDLSTMYDMLSSGQVKPEDILKTIDDKVKMGIEDADAGQKMKDALYKIHPELDPNNKTENSGSNWLTTYANWWLKNSPIFKFAAK